MFKQKCKKCGVGMRKIGPLPTTKLEGQPSQKFDGKLEFQCGNDDCDYVGDIVKIDIAGVEKLSDTQYLTVFLLVFHRRFRGA